MYRPLTAISIPAKWLIVSVLYSLFFSICASAAPSVRVAWDPNPESNIQGYRIYYGVVNTGTTSKVDVGRATSGSVTDLSFATRYFFYVTAYNTFDLESDPSAILYYTTPAPTPISVVTEDGLLAIAPVELQIPAAIEGDPSSPVTVSWQQLSGPSQVSIQGSGTITPTVQLTTVGDYYFKVQINDTTTSDQANVKVKLVPPATGSGSAAPLKLEPPVSLPDGTAFYWNSEPNYYYHVGIKTDLNLPYWILLESNIPSQGVYTYWVTDSDVLSASGFFGIIGTR